MYARITRISRTITLLITIFYLSFPAYAKYSGGTGEPNDPYQIATTEDLMLLGETPNDYNRHFILTADIDLDPNLPGRMVFDRAVIAPGTNDSEGGFQGTSFTGGFDGSGHTISHLTVTGRVELGLFGRLDSVANVKNLSLEAVQISGEWDVGGLAGQNYGATIVSSYTTGKVSGGFFVGGLIGYNEWGHITESYSSATVSGDVYVGGLVGQDQMGSISFSYSTGTVNGDISVGGLVGDSNGGCIVWSYSTGSVNGTGSDIGGLVGSNYWGLITTSYSTGAVTGHEFVGGLVGGTNGYSKIVSSYSMSSVSGISDVGGLVGINSGRSYIDSSYSSGMVSGTYDIGGLVGSNNLVDLSQDESISSSFWDIETSGQITSAGGIAKETTEMKDIKNFLDAYWDFETVWIIPNGDYPRLERRESEVPDSNGWIRLSPMKMARDQFAGGVIGDEIFVFGGNSMRGWNLFSGEKYNIATDTWSDIADNPYYGHQFEDWLGLGVEELSGIGFDGKFYVFGADEYNYNEMYDSVTNTWTTLAEKLTRTVAAIPVVYEGKIYLFGGATGEDENWINLSTVEVYDPDQNTWREVRHMPKALDSPAVAVHDHSAYVIGGYDENIGTMNDEVMRYDFRTDTWIRDYDTAPSYAARVYSYATQTPVINGKAYLVGGIQGDYENSWSVDTFTIFDIESKSWEPGPALPVPREAHLTVISKNTIYVIGGKNSGRQGEIEFDNAKDTVFALSLPESP